MSERQTLRKIRKNEVFHILQNTGLNPAHFTWSEEESKGKKGCIVSKLYYDKDSYFQFDLTGGKPLLCIFSPGIDKPVDRVRTNNWEESLRYAVDWANLLKKEIEAPDLWRQIGNYRAKLSVTFSVDLPNENFSPHEAAQIAEKLKQIPQKMEQSFSPTEAEIEYVHSRIDYLVDALNRLGRIDFRNVLVAVIIGIFIRLAFDPEQANLLWSFFSEAVSPLLPLSSP